MKKMKRWWWRQVGYPCWTVDNDGGVRESRIRRIGNGDLVVRGTRRWVLAKPNGSVSSGYLNRWSATGEVLEALKEGRA